jgi:hypothetical protein
VGCVLLVAVCCLWATGVGRGDPRADPASGPTAAGKDFPEVGKVYTFDFGGPQASVTAQVVDGSSGNWVKVTSKGQGRDGATLWVNLAQVRFAEQIVPE